MKLSDIPSVAMYAVTIDELMREALALSATDRAAIARELLGSLESLTEAEVEQLWIEEAQRRKWRDRRGNRRNYSRRRSRR